MERQSQQETSFKLTNLTNRVLTDSSCLKRKQSNKARAFLGSFAHKSVSCLAATSKENNSANSVPKQSSDSQLAPKNQTINSSAKEAGNQCHVPPRFSRTLRKVNMEYFRGKRVIFKQSNVRISFEIVENIFD